MARIDYPALERWLTEPAFEMPGVNQAELIERLRRRDLDAAGFMWAKDLAAVYAFVKTV